MIIALFALIGLLGFIFLKINKYDDSILSWVGISLISIAIVMLLIMIVIHAVTFLNMKGEIASLQAQYDILMYQVEHHFYEDEIMSVSMQDFMKEVTEWNTHLAECQANQDNFWIGIFYPNIYNQFNFITL